MDPMRSLVIATIVGVIALTALSPAHAQRDPFEPAIETGEEAVGSEEPAEEEPVSQVPGPQVGPGVANTGADNRPWLALAYALIALGAALIVIGRLRQQPE
jgi:hypothetical protein